MSVRQEDHLATGGQLPFDRDCAMSASMTAGTAMAGSVGTGCSPGDATGTMGWLPAKEGCRHAAGTANGKGATYVPGRTGTRWPQTDGLRPCGDVSGWGLPQAGGRGCRNAILRNGCAGPEQPFVVGA